MKQEWSTFVNHHYEDVDVWVTVPTQESGHELLLDRDFEFPEEMPETPTVFTPTMPVINFQVLEREAGDGEGKPVQKFSPPMVLRVRIDDDAKELAKAHGRQLRLAFWDGSEWVLFTKQKHLFHLTPYYGFAVIRDWGDPPVAWGE